MKLIETLIGQIDLFQNLDNKYIRILSSQDAEDRLIHLIFEQFGQSLIIYPKPSKKDVAAAIGFRSIVLF